MLEHEKKIDGQQKGQLNGILKGRSIIDDWICMECLSEMKIIVNLWQLPYIHAISRTEKILMKFCPKLSIFKTLHW